MGCSSSRLDDLPAVSHCRRRCKSIDAACTHFTSLAESHSAYMHTLSSLAETLVQTLTFFPPESSLDSGADLKRDGDRNSEPGSGHIHFTPSSDDDDEDNHQGAENETTFSSSFYENGAREAEILGGTVLVDGARENHAPPPPPPPASSLTWDLMNFFAPYDMALHIPESYNLLRERTLMDSDQPEIKEVVQVQALKSQNSDVVEHEKSRSTENVNPADDSSVKSEEKKFRAAVDVLQEIRLEFEKASKTGYGVLKLLKSEADENNQVFQLDSSEKANLPTILRKLSIWEQKLYAEVKAEEEMRMRHEELERKLRKQDEKGSDAQKVDATQKALMSLTPKMKIAFQVVDRISIVSSKLRDEELWPCLQDLIQELRVMWVEMLECHKQHVKAINEVAEIHRFPSEGDLTNEQVVAAMELKLKFQTWIVSFCSWICSQRGYVKSLNKWLQRCLVEEQKELIDADESDSPTRGAPAVIFVICRKWAEGVKKIDGGEVIDAAEACVANVDHLLQRVNANIQQRVIIDGDLEKRVKALEAKEKEMLRALEIWKKNVAKNLPPAANAVILASEALAKDSENLQPGLKRILDSLEALASSFAQVYQDLIPNAADSRIHVGQDVKLMI